MLGEDGHVDQVGESVEQFVERSVEESVPFVDPGDGAATRR
jgi:hypothetical protein